MFKYIELNQKINEKGKFVKIQNHSNKSVGVYETSTLVDVIRPYRFSVLKNEKYELKEIDLITENENVEQFLSITMYKGEVFEEQNVVGIAQTSQNESGDVTEVDIDSLVEKALKKELERLEDEKTTMEENFKAQQQEMNLLKEEITSLKGDLSYSENRIVQAQNEITQAQIDLTAAIAAADTAAQEAAQAIIETNTLEINVLETKITTLQNELSSKIAIEEALRSEVKELMKQIEVLSNQEEKKVMKEARFAKLVGFSDIRTGGTIGTLNQVTNMFSYEATITKKMVVDVFIQPNQELDFEKMKSEINIGNVQVIRSRNNDYVNLQKVEVKKMIMTENFVNKGYKGFGTLTTDRTAQIPYECLHVRMVMEAPSNDLSTTAGTLTFKITNSNLTESYQNCLVKIYQY